MGCEELAVNLDPLTMIVVGIDCIVDWREGRKMNDEKPTSQGAQNQASQGSQSQAVTPPQGAAAAVETKPAMPKQIRPFPRAPEPINIMESLEARVNKRTLSEQRDGSS